MSDLKKRAYNWIVGKYRISSAIPEGDKIIQELLARIEELEQAARVAPLPNEIRHATHQQRVVIEKEELDKKANALSGFIGLNPVFETLDPAEQERLKEQNDIMWQYSEILGARIAAF